jgi:hypothetical protein
LIACVTPFAMPLVRDAPTCPFHVPDGVLSQE